MSILARLQAHLFGRSIPVLCYHQVRPDSGMTPEKFGRHLDIITKTGFRTVGLRHLHAVICGSIPMREPLAVVTFDDCTLDNWFYAVPELVQRDMTAVFFAITDYLLPGTARSTTSPHVVPQKMPAFGDIINRAAAGDASGFMNQDEIRGLIHHGMEVYSHSAAHQPCFTDRTASGTLHNSTHWSHSSLVGPDRHMSSPIYPVGSAYAHRGFGFDWHGQPLRLDTDAERKTFCIDDFTRSKSCLEAVLKRPCPFLCLPWGQYDDITIDAARQAGYDAVLTLDRTPTTFSPETYTIGRRAVRDKKTDLWLRTRLIADALKFL